MLHINDLTYRVQGRTLFDRATAVVPEGRAVGLVGPNGSGKSTLFRLIVGEIEPDGGTLSVRPGALVGMVGQDAPSGPDSLIETVLSHDKERAALMAEANHATDPHRIGEIHTRLADIEAHGAPARAAKILSGLGFDDMAQQRPCASFSGGWRMRVALAGALFRRPDLLLLDEPTNHLDLEAALWLENHLANWSGAMLIISHERAILNAVADEIVHLDEGKLIRYAGNYDGFEKKRAEKMASNSKLRAKQLAEQRRIRSFVDRFRAKASKARQARSRLKMLERMVPIATAVENKTVTFDFPNPAPLAPPLIALEDVAVGYGEKPVLTKLNQRIDMDDRIGILGANGNGKSTLIKLSSGRLRPMSGRVRKSSKLNVGYFAQNQLEELNPDRTPLEELSKIMPMATEAKVRAQLGRFGFGVDKAETPVENLSGGEKARLLFSLITRDAPHIMFLDEPTNHLDVDSREALVEALNGYDGAVVLVSHDAHLIGLVCDRLWLVEDGAVEAFDGDIDDYKRHVVDQRRGDAGASEKTTKPGGRKTRRRERAKARGELRSLRNRAKQAEHVLEKLRGERETLEAKLADPDLYGNSRERFAELGRALRMIEAEMERTERNWLEALEALEASEMERT